MPPLCGVSSGQSKLLRLCCVDMSFCVCEWGGEGAHIASCAVQRPSLPSYLQAAAALDRLLLDGDTCIGSARHR